MFEGVARCCRRRSLPGRIHALTTPPPTPTPCRDGQRQRVGADAGGGGAEPGGGAGPTAGGVCVGGGGGAGTTAPGGEKGGGGGLRVAPTLPSRRRPCFREAMGRRQPSPLKRGRLNPDLCGPHSHTCTCTVPQALVCETAGTAQWEAAMARAGLPLPPLSAAACLEVMQRHAVRARGDGDEGPGAAGPAGIPGLHAWPVVNHPPSKHPAAGHARQAARDHPQARGGGGGGAGRAVHCARGAGPRRRGGGPRGHARRAAGGAGGAGPHGRWCAGQEERAGPSAARPARLMPCLRPPAATPPHPCAHPPPDRTA